MSFAHRQPVIETVVPMSNNLETRWLLLESKFSSGMSYRKFVE